MANSRDPPRCRRDFPRCRMRGSAPRLQPPAVERQRLSSPRAFGETTEQEIPRRSFVPALIVRTPCERLGIGAASLALEELPFDVVLGNELFNPFTKYFGHRHGF